MLQHAIGDVNNDNADFQSINPSTVAIKEAMKNETFCVINNNNKINGSARNSPNYFIENRR